MEQAQCLLFQVFLVHFICMGGKNSVEQITSLRSNFPWKAMAWHLIYYFSAKALNIPILTPNVPKSGIGPHILGNLKMVQLIQKRSNNIQSLCSLSSIWASKVPIGHVSTTILTRRGDNLLGIWFVCSKSCGGGSLVLFPSFTPPHTPIHCYWS